MKTNLNKLCRIIFTSMICLSSQAETIIAITDKGNWNESSTWNLERLPICGDTVYIPSGIEVKFNESINFEKKAFNMLAMKLIVSGTLSFEAGKNLNLSQNSTLILNKNGEINRSNHGKKTNSFISIKSLKIWTSKLGKINGPQILGEEIYASQELIDFEVLNFNDTFLISWKIKQLDEIGYYELLTSKNGKNWESIKKMKAVDNDSIEKMLCHIYRSSKTHKNVYFRLDACDLNGKKTILDILKQKTKVNCSEMLTGIPKMLFRSAFIVILTNIKLKK